ncbi:MAG: monovalent cation/H+ antiporter complex subunit F [Desulfonatronovibrionaceae bacterium]
MDHFTLFTALFLCMLMLISLYRAVFGPTVLDRLIGANAIGTKTVVLLLVIGFLYDRVDMFVDIALTYALLNFVTVLAASKYFYKKRGLRK